MSHERRIITEAEAAAWKYRGRAPRPMTATEAADWDAAQAEGDRATLLRIKRACWGNSPRLYGPRRPESPVHGQIEDAEYERRMEP